MSTSAVVNFVRDKIYCFPYQDQQYHFRLVQVTPVNKPSYGKNVIYQVSKDLPTSSDYYHVYAIGQVNTDLLNLLSTNVSGLIKDKWYNFEEDMTSRNFIMSLYNVNGLIFPRKFSYYCFTREKGLVIAVKVDNNFVDKYDYNSIQYFRVYSNSYFSSNIYHQLGELEGIYCKGRYVNDNLAKVQIQTEIAAIKVKGGDVLIYVNGMYNTAIELTIPNGSYIEYVYDQSITSKEVLPIAGLRTFLSIRNQTNKYLLNRSAIPTSIEFYDDTDVYITTTGYSNNKGVYYYRHNGKALSMVTDKDFAISVDYVHNQALYLNNMFSGTTTTDKTITIVNRVAGGTRNLVYSSLKLHELYKLSSEKRLDVMLGTGDTLSELRCESLESSDYFKITETTSLPTITTDLAVSALGYDSICYYFAPSYKYIGNLSYTDIPYLYRDGCTVYEYDSNGLYIEHYTSAGMTYTKQNVSTKHLEFIYGKPISVLPRYYTPNETVVLQHSEYTIYYALFVGNERAGNWTDITNSVKVAKIGNAVTFPGVSAGSKIQIRYANQIVIKTIEYDLSDSTMFIPITVQQDLGDGVVDNLLELSYSNIDVYLNKIRLTEGLDYFMDFPYLNIVNKKYLNYTLPKQVAELRMYGESVDKEFINDRVEEGFVSHGVLSRNNLYDIREDRNMCFFIDGKVKNKDSILYAETDNTVRIDSSINGLPYIMAEPYVPIKTICNKETKPIRDLAKVINSKFSQFFTKVLPQPTLALSDMVIASKHFLYSPTISKIIEHTLDGTVPSNFYTNSYSNQDLLTFLEGYNYLYSLDPLNFDLPEKLVEIHPHLGNTTINLNIFQYRFIDNVNKLVSKGRVNLSGYISVSM